ncbi:hypothetical protein FBU30_011277 [Linnemannia zychae]|nr:hypothetical protein FBU30_011277 [Linnemannia zychae]
MSFTTTVISVLIRSAVTVMAITYGSEQQQQHSLYSASTTPIIPCTHVFLGADKNKPGKEKVGFEPEYMEAFKDTHNKSNGNDNAIAHDNNINIKTYVKKDQNLGAIPEYKAKQKDSNSIKVKKDKNEQHLLQSEQSFNHFESMDAAVEDDWWREYRNRMYYSNNFPPPHSSVTDNGSSYGGESSRVNSRRSSVFTPYSSTLTPPSPSFSSVDPITDTAAIEITTMVVSNSEDKNKAPLEKSANTNENDDIKEGREDFIVIIVVIHPMIRVHVSHRCHVENKSVINLAE